MPPFGNRPRAVFPDRSFASAAALQSSSCRGRRKTGEKHIVWDKHNRKYRLQKRIRGKLHPGPYFATLAEAIAARPAWLRSLKRIKPFVPKRTDDEDDRLAIFADKSWKPETTQLWELPND